MHTNEITTAEARQAGYTRGRNKASGVSLRFTAEWVAENGGAHDTVREEIVERMKAAASQADKDGRDSLVFEFLTAELNERENSSELWAAFEDGVVQGAADEIDVRLEHIEDRFLRSLVVEAAARLARRVEQRRPAIVQ